MKIFLGTDHAGYELKEKLKDFLGDLGYDVEDRGAFELDPNDDYPDFISLVAKEVSQNPESRGIVLGGSGQGEAICANRFPNVRASVFYGPPSHKPSEGQADPFEIIKLSREHNDANILSLGSRFLSEEEAKKSVKLWLETDFSGDDRHVRRIKKLEANI